MIQIKMLNIDRQAHKLVQYIHFLYDAKSFPLGIISSFDGFVASVIKNTCDNEH